MMDGTYRFLLPSLEPSLPLDDDDELVVDDDFDGLSVSFSISSSLASPASSLLRFDSSPAATLSFTAYS
jgi:hypothetical protein